MSPAAAAAASGEASLAPLIAAQLNFLLSHSPLPIKVDQIWSGCRDLRYADRFTLCIPFCLDYIKWDFLYNALYPKVAPDVVFGPDDEGFQPLLVYHDGGVGGGEEKKAAESSCLSNWDCRDPSKLLALVQELRDFYVGYQKKKVAEVDDARVKFEISTILSREGIEVCMVSSADRPEEVKFAVPLLDVDFNKLVPGCPWKFQQKIFLQVIFPISRSYSSAPSTPRLKLISTPDLKAFFSVDDIKLPPWLDGMCMAEYLPTLEDNLKVQVVEAAASIGARRRFIEALAPVFGRPLEADPVFCRRATILSISGIFTFLVHFAIPLQFPKQQPVLTLQSSQHFNSQGTPIMSPPINDYPWSPRWDPAQMVERIFDFLADECLNFKKFCSDAIPPQQ